MPKRYIPDICLGALLAVCVFAFGFLAASQISSPVQQQAASQADQKANNDGQTVDFWPWDAATTSNMIMALFTGLLFGVACIQIRHTRILERARVSVNVGDIDTDTLGGLIGHVVFENTGRLPASNFRWRIKIDSDGRKDDWFPQKLTSADLEGEAVLPVGAKWTMGSKKLEREPEGRWEYIYVWGRVEYTDGFGRGRFTNFCHRYPWANRTSAVIGFQDTGSDVVTRIDGSYARFHKNGNETD